MKSAEKKLQFSALLWAIAALVGAIFGTAEATYTALICASVFGAATELARCVRPSTEGE